MACFGSPDKEERAAADLEFGPMCLWIGRRGFAAKTPEDFCLERIGVLKLIDKHVQEALAERAPHVFMAAQKIPRGENQIIEIKKRSAALVITVAIKDKPRFRDQRFKHLACCGLFQSGPRFAAILIVKVRSCIQPIAFGFRQSGFLRGVCPFGFLAVGQK